METLNLAKHPLIEGSAALKLLEGNWWKFPPPSPGRYDVRQKMGEGRYTMYLSTDVSPRISLKKPGLVCLGMVCETTMKLAGYEFRFPIRGDVRGNKTVFVPYRVRHTIIREPDGEKHLQEDGKMSMAHVLPIARSIEEARYVMSRLHDLWPDLATQPISYMEEKL